MLKPFGFVARNNDRINSAIRFKEIIKEAAEESRFVSTGFWDKITSNPACSTHIAEEILTNIRKRVEDSTFLKTIGAQKYVETELKQIVESIHSFEGDSEKVCAAHVYVKSMVDDETYDMVMHFPKDLRVKAIKILTCIALYTEWCSLTNLEGEWDDFMDSESDPEIVDP